MTADDLYFFRAAADGSMSSSGVQDGVENNLFLDLSPSDSYNPSGGGSARLYVAAMTPSQELFDRPYLGIRSVPQNPAVEVILKGANISAAPPSETIILNGSLSGTVFTTDSQTRSAYDVPVVVPVGSVVEYVSTYGKYRRRYVVSGYTGENPSLWNPLPSVPVPPGSNAGSLTLITRLEGFAAAVTTTAGVAAGATSVPVTPPRLRAQAMSLSSPLYVPTLFRYDRVAIQHPTDDAVWETRLLTDVLPHTGTLVFDSPLANTYPAGAVISSIVAPLQRPGTAATRLLALVETVPYTLQTWARNWSPPPAGTLSPAAKYTGLIPLVNDGAVTEEWALVFRNSTTFEVVGQRLGTVAVGNIENDFSPLNPATNQPYFTMLASGWSQGWLTGYAVRFRTSGASAYVDALRYASPDLVAGDEDTDNARFFVAGEVDG
ncbi:hypothetical protein [Rubrivivax sp. JA1026]|uniref:hypothetical protein n=1 Tax=Rubrivivax sp. JA1026 TaxID=2710888 RepID=UPI0013E8F7DD|nr:hypothetical protein [Rubrivivax sp. JA1026]